MGHLHFLHRAWRYRLRTERAELAYVRSLDLTGKTVVDIGAHRGIFSYWMSRAVGPTGRVVAFEPQPEMIRQFKDFQDSFFWRKNITLVESGLSSSAGVATMRRIGGHTGGASVEHPDLPGADAFEIPLTALGDYFVANPPPAAAPVAFIKCDVEGHERAVFQGGARLLAEHRPRLLFECHDEQVRAGDLFRELHELGYRGWFLDGSRRVPVERFDQERDAIDRPYLNFVFEPSHD
jgi:FkbM family methyltransferase